MAAKYDPLCLILDWLIQHQKVMKKKNRLIKHQNQNTKR